MFPPEWVTFYICIYIYFLKFLMYDYNHFARTTQKTAVIKETCLLIHCMSMDDLLFRAFASAGMCSASRCLAMDLYVTVYLWKEISMFLLFFSNYDFLPPKIKKMENARSPPSPLLCNKLLSHLCFIFLFVPELTMCLIAE
jgi:hypothetical protein